MHAPAAERRPDGLYLVGNGLSGSLVISPWCLPRYQELNVATAAAACQELRNLGLVRSPDALQRAVAGFEWPGRYQWLSGDPPLLLDGAHNPHAIVALLEAMAEDPRLSGRPVHGVFTALRDKAAEEMVALLRTRLASFHLAPVGSRRTRTCHELQALVADGKVYEDVGAAMDAAKRAAGRRGVVLVTGSLFLVGAALAIATDAPHDPAVDG